MHITALLVAHDGDRWLGGVLDGLEAQRRRPDAVVAVDTGSADGSPRLLTRRLGSEPLRLPAETGFPDAVRAGLERLPAPVEDEWVWLLHDDCRPDPACLDTLVDAVRRSRGAGAGPVAEEGLPTAEDVFARETEGHEIVALGPTLREWPDLKRLLEVGVTISGSGRRETGLESGEYDQGQHVEPRRVLAVSTAGMLVRRDVLESVGLDPHWPVFGNDVDFGWRLARAGYGSLVVPDAVAFHAEAAHRGMRTGAASARPRRGERAASIRTLLAHSGPVALLPRLVRLYLGGLLRALAFVLLRSPAEARDEMAALGAVGLRSVPGLRRSRARASTVRRSRVRPLLAPVWMPLRHGLDAAGGAVRLGWAAAMASLTERTGSQEHGSVGARLVTSPRAWGLVVVTVLALVAGWGTLTGAPLHGGALLPAPDGVGRWWSQWADTWHWVGVGSAEPGPAYLLPFAVLATVLLGQPAAVVWVLFLLTVPVAYAGAARLVRRLVPGRWTPAWAGLLYALLPVVGGAVAQGRLGTVAGLLLLPWVATPALRLTAADGDTRRRATWRTALGVALLCTLVPAAWAAVLLLGLLALVPGAVPRGRLAPWQLLALLVPALLVSLPWLLPALGHPGALLLEAGRADALPVRPGLGQLLAGRPGGPGGASWLWGLGLPLAALLALLRADTRARVLRAWAVALVAVVVLVALSAAVVTLPGVPVEFRPWAGFWPLVAQGALVAAVALAADGLPSRLRRQGRGALPALRGAVAAVGGLALAVTAVAGTAWWVGSDHPGPVYRGPVGVAPAYMSELADSAPAQGTLVLRGGPGLAGADRGPVRYQLLRGASLRLGEDAVAAATTPDPGFRRVVTDVLSGGKPRAAAELARYGVAYVYAPGPVSDQVGSAVDASNGFTTASAPDPRARAWRVGPTPRLESVRAQHGWAHPVLLVVQVLALLALLVLVVPSREALRRNR